MNIAINIKTKKLLKQVAAALIVALTIPIITVITIYGSGQLVALVHDASIGGAGNSLVARVDLDAENAPSQALPEGSQVRGWLSDTDVTAPVGLTKVDGYNNMRWRSDITFPANTTAFDKIYQIQYHLGDNVWMEAAGFMRTVTVKSNNPAVPGGVPEITSVEVVDTRIGSLGGKCRLKISGNNIFGQVKVKAVYPSGQTTEALLTHDAVDDSGYFRIQFPVNNIAGAAQKFTIWCATGQNGSWYEWKSFPSATGYYDFDDFYPTQSSLDYSGGAVSVYMGGNLPQHFGGNLKIKGIASGGRETSAVPVRNAGSGSDGTALLDFPANSSDMPVIWTLYYSVDGVSWNPNPHTGKNLSGNPYTVTVQPEILIATSPPNNIVGSVTTENTTIITTTDTALTTSATDTTTPKETTATKSPPSSEPAVTTVTPSASKTQTSTKETEADIDALGSGPSGSDFDTSTDLTAATVTTTDVKPDNLPTESFPIKTLLIIITAVAAGAAASVYIILFLKKK